MHPAVMGEDVLMRRAAAGDVGVMMAAQDVGRSVQLVVSDAPTALGVAVDLAHARIDTDRHGSDEGRFSEV